MDKKGKFDSLKKEREGKEFINKWGEKAIVIRYGGINDVDIRYDNGYVQNLRWHSLVKGFHNPYTKSVYGVGYLGEGKYNVGDKVIYSVWSGMLERCYNPYFLNKCPAYRDCFVCEEWHCFQNFAKWYEEKYYEIEGERIELDKDILYKNNKIYSPNTCILVPGRINQLFIKQHKKDKKYPIGITEYHNGIRARCSILDKNGKCKIINLGCFPYNKVNEAFTCYKNFKENYIKRVADEYKDRIPQELYDALYKYKVEIDD